MLSDNECQELQFMKKIVMLGVISVMALTGCAVKQDKTPDIKRSAITTVVSDNSDDASRMEQCSRELEALKQINIAVYNKRKQEFDSLMSLAGIYSGVRSDVSTSTQKTIDAYYRYQADRLCADISIDTLSNLAKIK